MTLKEACKEIENAYQKSISLTNAQILQLPSHESMYIIGYLSLGYAYFRNSLEMLCSNGEMSVEMINMSFTMKRYRIQIKRLIDLFSEQVLMSEVKRT